MQSACAEPPIIPLPRQAIGLTPPALHAPCLLIVVPITFYPTDAGGNCALRRMGLGSKKMPAEKTPCGAAAEFGKPATTQI
jgi:hypothetical protein